MHKHKRAAEFTYPGINMFEWDSWAEIAYEGAQNNCTKYFKNFWSSFHRFFYEACTYFPYISLLFPHCYVSPCLPRLFNIISSFFTQFVVINVPWKFLHTRWKLLQWRRRICFHVPQFLFALSQHYANNSRRWNFPSLKIVNSFGRKNTAALRHRNGARQSSMA